MLPELLLPVWASYNMNMFGRVGRAVSSSKRIIAALHGYTYTPIDKNSLKWIKGKG
jgi:hypothetical protein